MASVLKEWKGNDVVQSVAVTPNGSRIGAGYGDDIVIVDADSAQTVLGPLRGHTHWINSVAFSPDGRTLASGSNDHTIRLWDTEVGKAVMRPLAGHTQSVCSVAYTSDGRLLVSGSLDRTICLWDVRTGQPAGQTIDTGTRVWAVTVSPDGMKVSSGGDDGTIRTYDTATRSMLFQRTGHTWTIASVAFSPDGHRLASGSWDRTVRLWDGSTGRAIGRPLEGHTYWVRSVSFSPDGRYVASGSDDMTLRIWDADTGASRCDPLSGHTSYVMSTGFTPAGRRLVSGSFRGTIKIWDVQHLQFTGTVKSLPSTELAEVAITTDLPSAASNGAVLVASIQAVDPIRPIQPPELDIEITASTSAQDIISHLVARGCIDMTNLLDWTTLTDIPVSSGGFGDIYQCSLASSVEVAIKTVRLYAGGTEHNRKALKRAAREIYTWSKLRHPNVQPLLGLVVFRSGIGMVATWEVNGNLLQYLEQHPEADRCLMCTQVADGLAYLHASGVVHGDIKGVNVLVSRDGCAQLADFGSTVLQEYTLQFSQTSTKASWTVRWAAPEILEGEKCSQPADVYALGMTVLETVTGQAPWIGKTDISVITAVVTKKATPARPAAHIPIGSKHGNTLWSLLKSCWAYEPNDRPSAEGVRNMLRGITQAGLKRV